MFTGFKVTESEYRIIKNLGEASRMFLVKQGHGSAIVTFDLGSMPRHAEYHFRDHRKCGVARSDP